MTATTLMTTKFKMRLIMIATMAKVVKTEFYNFKFTRSSLLQHEIKPQTRLHQSQ